MDYPLPLPKSIIGRLFICMPMRFATEWRVSDHRGRRRLVCVHGYTAIFLILSMVEDAHKRTYTHTHTHQP